MVIAGGFLFTVLLILALNLKGRDRRGGKLVNAFFDCALSEAAAQPSAASSARRTRATVPSTS